jgi:hypothetical protein
MLVVNLHIASRVFLYCIDRASLFTGYGDMDYRMEGTNLHTFTTANTAVFLDMGLTVDKRDAVFRAVGKARPCKAPPAGITDKISIRRTGRTGRADSCQDWQRRGVLGKNLFDVFSQRFHLIIILLDIYAQKSHYPIPDHCPFFVNATTIRDTFLGNNGKGNPVRILFQSIIEELLKDFGLYPAFNQCVLIIQFKH